MQNMKTSMGSGTRKKELLNLWNFDDDERR